MKAKLLAAEQIKDVIQKCNIYVITNVVGVTHLTKTILKQSSTSYKLPKREWNYLITHIIEKFLKIFAKTLTNVISGF